MVEHVCGNKAKQMIQAIPLSNDTINRRISEMSQDICQQVIEQIKSSSAKISLQLEESCDVDNFSQLLVFVYYMWKRTKK